VLSNGYAQLALNVDNASVLSILGDVSGNGSFANTSNVLGASGIRLVVQTATGGAVSLPGRATVSVIANTSELATVRLDDVVDDAASVSVQESWVFSLSRASRSFVFSVNGGTVKDLNARAITRVMDLASLSIYGLFADGVVQMKGYAKGGFFPANNSLPRLYALGGGTAVDVGLVSTGTPCLVSNVGDSPSAFVDIAATAAVPALLWDQWQPDVWGGIAPGVIKAGTTWSATMTISPSNSNFPTLRLPAGPNLPADDLEALLTGVYGSSPGCLCTYHNEVVPGKRVAQIATTIARPDRGYSGTYNYFDPDNFISLSALLYSGDAFLQQQARAVVERSGAFLKPNGERRLIDPRCDYSLSWCKFLALCVLNK